MSGITRGSLIVGDSNNDPSYLSIGTANKVLSSDGTDLSWSQITNDMLSGSITNNKLNNSSITIGDTVISLGETTSLIEGINGVTIDGSEGLKLKNGNTGPGKIEFYERTTYGNNKVTLKGPDSTNDVTLYIPPRGGTIITSGDTSTITNNMLNGAITNDKLENQSITVTARNGLRNGGTVSLGGTVVLDVNVDDNTIEINNDAIRVKNGGITNDMLSGSISNSKLTNSSLTVTAGNGLTGGGTVNLGNTISLNVNVDDSSIELNSNSLKVKNSGITNDMLNGDISNNKLENNYVTIGNTELSLGSTSIFLE